MREWLVICLKAPLASFGENAGNAERGSADLPTRSALIGLAAAALGVEREDADGQRRLSHGLVTASALYDRGHPLADFHSFQSLHQSGKGAATRREALKMEAYLETSISRRHYRADGLWQGAYRLADSADPILTLETLRKAFEEPRFTLYLGRKSCSLSHPLAPRLTMADCVTTAFHAQFKAVARTIARPQTRLSLVSVENPPRLHLRNDDPRDRSKRWTFGNRQEWRFDVAADGVQEERT
jgi:CRISPR system Cascade subunit CasD